MKTHQFRFLRHEVDFIGAAIGEPVHLTCGVRRENRGIDLVHFECENLRVQISLNRLSNRGKLAEKSATQYFSRVMPHFGLDRMALALNFQLSVQILTNRRTGGFVDQQACARR